MSSFEYWIRLNLTLGGGLSSSSCQGHDTFVHLMSVNGDAVSNKSDSIPEGHGVTSLRPSGGGAQSLLRHLDADQDAPVPDHFDKGHAGVRVLVQRLVEEDDASEAAVDALVRTEENLPELSSVLLCVVHPDLGQTLPHAACDREGGTSTTSRHCLHHTPYIGFADQVSHTEEVTDPQTHPQPGCPSLERRCAGQSHAGLSSDRQTVMGTDASSRLALVSTAAGIFASLKR